MAVFTGPAFLVGIVGWLGERMTTRAFKISAAVFLTTSTLAAVGSIFALLGVVAVAVPDPVLTAMSVMAPRDWVAQAGLVTSAKVIQVVYSIFFRSYKLALS